MTCARLVGFKPVRKNTLRGFADVELPIGLRIRDVPVHVAVNGRVWASLPSKPAIDPEGRQLRDSRGKGKWSPILEWSDERLREAFSDRVCELVTAAHPEALS